MKKIAVSAGLVALGVAGMQSAIADSVISPKAWSLGATLRGFYDDNYNTANSGLGSLGVEVSPTISLNVPLRQTDLGMRYTYGFYYYQDRQDKGVNPIDQTHQFEVWLDHKFNTRWHLNVTDSFAVGQDPELLQGSGTVLRVQGDNIANHANLTLDTQWTRNFSTSAHYGNAWYDFSQSGGSATSPSLAGLLNRVEQNLGIDLQWTLRPETVFFLGYNFSLANYTGNEDIAPGNIFYPQNYRSDFRDSITHYAYLGLQHQFTANISGTIRAGGSYTDDINDPLPGNTSLTPYVDLSLNYTYTPGSYVQLGFTHDINATQVASVNANNGEITLNQETSVVYASINHKFTPSLIGTVIGRVQNSQYDGGAVGGENDQTYGVGVNLHYQINQHFSTEIGYNYDNSVSGLTSYNYQRNRVYLGLSANY